MTSKRMYWLLAGACILAFAASLNYPFLRCQDDWAYVTANRHLLAGWSHILQLMRTPVLGLSTPLPQASYLVDYSIAGKEPWIYHLINILWHTGMVLLVFRLFRELGLRRHPAFFAALIFAIHPQRVESVVWISERKDVMCGFFFVLCCVSFLAFNRKVRPAPKICQWGSWAAMIAALACKPSAAALPFVLLAMDFHRNRKFRFQPVIGHFVILAGYFLIAQTILTDTGKHLSDGGFRLMLGIRNYCVYFLKTIYPAEVCPLYPYIELNWQDYALAGLCLAVLAGLFFRYRRKVVYDVLPMLFCAGAVLVPVSGIMIFSNADFADRYSYIPSIFFLAAIFFLLPPIPEKFRKWTFCYPAVLLICTWSYLPCWNGDEALLEKASSVPSSNFRGTAQYAMLLAEQGKAAEGLQALENCGKDDPRSSQYRDYLQTLRQMLLLMIRYQAGEDPAKLYPEFSALLTPEHNRSHLQQLSYTGLIPFQTAHADCALKAGKPEKSAEIYESLARAYSTEPFTAPFYMGVAKMLRRDAAGAVGFFERALAASPNDEPTKRNLENARRLAARQQP